MPRIVKVAAVQSAPVGYDLPATLDKVSLLVQEAKSGGAQLVVLPEAFLSAYPRHTGGYYVGSRSDEQREWFARYVRSSVKVPEDAVGYDYLASVSERTEQEKEDYQAFTTLCGIARSHAVYISIGIVERSPVGSTLFCTNLLISPLGILLSKHRKLQPTAAERVVWSQGEARYPVKQPAPNTTASGNAKAGGAEVVEARRMAGDNLPVVPSEIGRIGGLICWENFMPLARYALYEKGVEIYTAPTADARPTWLPSMQHIGQEGRCYVISANQVHGAADFPQDYPAVVPPTSGNGEEKVKRALWSRGGSCIVGPLGQVLAGPLWDEEGIIYAELDLDALDGAKLDFDPVGHYARADLMKSLILQ